jgi:hypothetical protein
MFHVIFGDNGRSLSLVGNISKSRVMDMRKKTKKPMLVVSIQLVGDKQFRTVHKMPLHSVQARQAMMAILHVLKNNADTVAFKVSVR